MTSFDTSVQLPKPAGFMPAFKTQGQVYHKAGFLLPMHNQELKFLQIYFKGDEELETQRRCTVIPGFDRNLVQSPQNMLHNQNEYIRTFKTELENCKLG